MNKIPSSPIQGQRSNITRRAVFAGAIVAILGGGGYLVKSKNSVRSDENQIDGRMIDLNSGYTHHKENYDTLFIYADQNHTAPWIKRDGGQKDLNILTGNGNEIYTISIIGDEMLLALSSYDEEYIWKYNINTSLLELKGNIDFIGALEHFGRLQKFIKQQYPNF